MPDEDKPVPTWYRPPKPYEVGNFEAVRHGAFSARLVDARAQAILEQLQDEGCAWLTEVDGIQVDTWLKSRARYELLNEYINSRIEEFGIERGIEKISTKVWATMISQERNLMKATQDLGLDPTGRAKLLKDLGLAKQFARAGAKELAERGREIRRGRR